MGLQWSDMAKIWVTDLLTALRRGMREGLDLITAWSPGVGQDASHNYAL